MMATAAARYDLARFGMEVFRGLAPAGRPDDRRRPGQPEDGPGAAPDLRPDAEPKWVISMGVCASSGGMFNNYAIVQGVDHIVPVDIYLPGCPPRPEMLIDAILKLHEKIQRRAARREPRAAAREAEEAARRLKALPTIEMKGL
jgi:NADH-quinone oxidoreductase subunit B